MERESFEDEEIASVMNQYFVSIKVDREERPDVDAVYMAVVQTLTGEGGWPMTVFLTPDRRPIFGGTYFPPREGVRGARVGFFTLLQQVHRAYVEQPDKVEEQAAMISSEMAQNQRLPQGDGVSGSAPLHAAFETLRDHYDAEHGGFGFAPKFPRPVSLEFLLHYGKRSGKKEATEMVLQTLHHMARGGMYDQLGGGFHRYSVDREWLVPHFEKMLYDNAQLALVYLEAFQITKDDEFHRVARETLDYLDREMSDSAGGFWSATDADSEGEEGKFFVWRQADIISAFGEEEGKRFCEIFDVTSGGNFKGKNILRLLRPEAMKESAEEILSWRKKLYDIRKKRTPPHTDDKVLAAWNGLAIAAFARAGFQLDEPRYTARAVRAAHFVLGAMRKGSRLLRSYREGVAQIPAYLDDYAFFSLGLLELFETTGDDQWLTQAQAWMDVLLEEFWDEKDGGFFMTSGNHEALLFREKPYYDGAEPSGNSVAVWNLLRLASWTGILRYGVFADRALKTFSPVLLRQPEAVPFLLTALDYRLDRPKEVALILSGIPEADQDMMNVLRTSHIPNRVAVIGAEPTLERLEKKVPWLKDKKRGGGGPTAFVCENQTCDLPTSDPEVFRVQLLKGTPLP